MTLYGIQKVEGTSPQQWIVTYADMDAPGRSLPFNEAGPFFTETDARAQADVLNKRQAP